MNLFNDRELARRFRAGAVPAKERLCYFLIFLMFLTLTSTSTFLDFIHTPINPWDQVIDIFVLASTLLGMLWCYATNGRGDGSEFIERVTCLGFPIALQTLLLAIVVLVIIELSTEQDASHATTSQHLMLEMVTTLYFYVRLNGAIRIASH